MRATLRWKAGAELPPFVSTNTTAVSTLIALLDGTVDAVPQCAVSEAVAVQIWRLINDKDADVALKQAAKGYRGYYIILASLAKRTR